MVGSCQANESQEMAQRKSKVMIKKLRGMMLKKVAELVEESILETFA